MNQELMVASSPKVLAEYLEKGKAQIAAALPAHLKPDRMLRLAVTCFSTTPAIRKCTPVSILGAIIVASQIGLEPGIAGQGYLIPYGTNCTFVPGWQGLVGLLNNTGRATAWTNCVFEGDRFEYSLGSSPKLIHEPGENFGDPDKIIWVYACGKVNGSEQPVIECWPIKRVWRHRDRFNKVGQKHYSFVHPEMYARKVVLLQVLKYMPRSIELNNALVAANADEEGRMTKVEDGMVIDIDSAPGNNLEPADAKVTPAATGKPAEKIVTGKPVEKEKLADKAPQKPASADEPPTDAVDKAADASTGKAATNITPIPTTTTTATPTSAPAGNKPRQQVELEGLLQEHDLTMPMFMTFMATKYRIKVTKESEFADLLEISPGRVNFVISDFASFVQPIKDANA